MRSEAALALLLIGCVCAQVRYFGKDLGALTQLHHAVRGHVYAVDSRTLYLKDFNYDGEGPAAYFYVGTSSSPNAAGINSGTRLRDERGGTGPLRRYRGESITLSLPDGKTLKDYKWFSVWCDEYSINFGDVSIPRELEYPRPAKVSALRGVHAVSSDPIVIVDAQTLLVPNFSYDGEAPDAKFWVGRGEKPSPQGIRIPDENGKEAPLRKYDKKTIVLTLPGELTVFDIGHFAVWCEAFTVNFGHISLPRAQLANVPPSLKMLGVSPQSRNKALVGSAAPAATAATLRPRPHPRKPIAKLDATTYRPSHLRPGTGVLALLDQPADPSALHRRADEYKPPKEQLVTIQSSKEVHYHNEDEDPQDRRIQQASAEKQQETLLGHQQLQRQLQFQQQQQQQQIFYQQQPQQKYYQQQDYNQRQGGINYHQHGQEYPQQPQQHYQQFGQSHQQQPNTYQQRDPLQQQYEQQKEYLQVLRQKLQDDPYQYRLVSYEAGK